MMFKRMKSDDALKRKKREKTRGKKERKKRFSKRRDTFIAFFHSPSLAFKNIRKTIIKHLRDRKKASNFQQTKQCKKPGFEIMKKNTHKCALIKLIAIISPSLPPSTTKENTFQKD